jgi:hypothetical protein
MHLWCSTTSMTGEWRILTYITNYIYFNVTQQDTQRKLPDDDVHTSKHVGTVEFVNTLSE